MGELATRSCLEVAATAVSSVGVDESAAGSEAHADSF